MTRKNRGGFSLTPTWRGTESRRTRRPFGGFFAVRPQNFRRRHLFVIEKPIRSSQFRPAEHCPRNADIRAIRERLQQVEAHGIEPFVAEIDTLSFILEPQPFHFDSFHELTNFVEFMGLYQKF